MRHHGCWEAMLGGVLQMDIGLVILEGTTLAVIFLVQSPCFRFAAGLSGGRNIGVALASVHRVVVRVLPYRVD
jgi:hypothetical protein